MNKKFSLTAANLKWIAIILMVINHLGYCLYDKCGINNYFTNSFNFYISRASFIIFAYQIAEGMFYTKNRKKYIAFLFIFAVISEIPYDMCFYDTPFDFHDQNVFFNLALGALDIYIIDKLGKKPIHIVLVTTVSIIISLLLNFNYLSMAEILIVAFYYLRDDKKKQLIITALLFILFDIVDYAFIYVTRYEMSISQILVDSNFWQNVILEGHGLLAWPLLMLYKGEKGKNINKWFFYFFYPGHLIAIYFLCKFLIK